MKWPVVMCAQCNKPVELMEMRDDFLKDEQVLRVRCHGEWDEMRVRLFDLTQEMVDQLNNSQGVAFTTKRLEAA
jgi:hypothetical protein